MCLPHRRILVFFAECAWALLIPSNCVSMPLHFDWLRAIHFPVFRMLPVCVCVCKKSICRQYVNKICAQRITVKIANTLAKQIKFGINFISVVKLKRSCRALDSYESIELFLFSIHIQCMRKQQTCVCIIFPHQLDDRDIYIHFNENTWS